MEQIVKNLPNPLVFRIELSPALIVTMNPMNRFTLLSSLILILLANLTACGKDDPVPDVEEKTKIVYSEWMDIVWHPLSSNTTKQMVLEEPRITESFLRKGGIVLMFLKRLVPVMGGGTADVIWPLPSLSTNWFHGFQVTSGAGNSGILFFLYSVDNSIPIPDELWEYAQIRYILIDGADPINNDPQGVNLDDYESLTQTFGITP